MPQTSELSEDQAIEQLKALPEDRQRKVLAALPSERKQAILSRLSSGGGKPKPAQDPGDLKTLVGNIMQGRKWEDLKLREKIQVLSLGFGEKAQQEAYRAAGPESQGKGYLDRAWHQLKSLLAETGETALKPMAGLAEPKTAAIAASGVVAPEIPAAVFGAQGLHNLIPQATETQKKPTPGNVQDLLLTGSQILMAPAAATTDIEKATPYPKPEGKTAGAVRGVLGFGPDVTEEAARKTAGKHIEAQADVAEKQQQENAKTEAANRAAIEKHATERRETIIQNEQEQAAHLAEVDQVKQENVKAQERAMDEYRAEVRRVQETNQAAQDQVTERGRLARQVEDQSRQLGEGVQQAERNARAEGNRRYSVVQEAIGEETRPSGTMVSSVRNAEANILRTPENIKIFKDVLNTAPEEEVQTSAGPTRPGEPLYEQLVREGAIQPDQPMTFAFLQGVYTKLGRMMFRLKSTPGMGDVYKAVKSVHDTAGNEMQAMAEDAGVGDALTDAKNYWREMNETFYDKDSTVAKTLKRVGKLDPGYYAEPFISGKSAQRGITAIERYDPHLARLAQSIRQTHEQMSQLPKTAKVAPEPALPKTSAKATPEPPAPKELPSKPEMKAPKKIAEPETPEIDVRQAKMKEVERLRKVVRGLSRYDLNRLTFMGLGSLTGFVTGGGVGAVLGGVGAEALYFMGRRGMAVALDKPAVVEWLTRPQPGDVQILRQLPPEVQNAVRVEFGEILKEQQAHSRDLKPPREIQQFLNEKPLPEDKEEKKKKP